MAEAGRAFLDTPMEAPFIPAWRRVQTPGSDLARDLHEAGWRTMPSSSASDGQSSPNDSDSIQPIKCRD